MEVNSTCNQSPECDGVSLIVSECRNDTVVYVNVDV